MPLDVHGKLHSLPAEANEEFWRFQSAIDYVLPPRDRSVAAALHKRYPCQKLPITTLRCEALQSYFASLQD